MPPERPLVFISHSDEILCAGLAAILGESGLFEVASRWTSPHLPAHARVIVTDYQAGLAVAREYGAPADGHPAVLVVTSFDKEFQVRGALDAGVHGYLTQNCPADELREAVRQLAQGLRYVSARFAASNAASVTRAVLTPRESQVLRLLGDGLCNKVIARELDIGVGTVKTHIKGLLTKLDAKARTHAVVIASQRGLLGADAGPARGG